MKAIKDERIEEICLGRNEYGLKVENFTSASKLALLAADKEETRQKLEKLHDWYL